MSTYRDILFDILENGTDREGRSGYTRAVFARQTRFDLGDGFPYITVQPLDFTDVKGELLWFIEGSTDNNRLKEITGKEKTVWSSKVEADYWKPRAQFDGDLGRIYGAQWRQWRTPHGQTIDQLTSVIEKIKADPHDRRLVVTAWNPGELDEMAAPPLRLSCQFFVTQGTISIHAIQRSCDMLSDAPFVIASYSLLLSMIAHVTKLNPGECIISFNDAHIYNNDIEVIKNLPETVIEKGELRLNPEIQELENFTMNDIELEKEKVFSRGND